MLAAKGLGQLQAMPPRQGCPARSQGRGQNRTSGGERSLGDNPSPLALPHFACLEPIRMGTRLGSRPSRLSQQQATDEGTEAQMGHDLAPGYGQAPNTQAQQNQSLGEG